MQATATYGRPRLAASGISGVGEKTTRQYTGVDYFLRVRFFRFRVPLRGAFGASAARVFLRYSQRSAITQTGQSGFTALHV